MPDGSEKEDQLGVGTLQPYPLSVGWAGASTDCMRGQLVPAFPLRACFSYGNLVVGDGLKA